MMILKNLQRIKFEKEAIDVVISTLEEINSILKDKKIELILSKTNNILKLFKNKNDIFLKTYKNLGDFALRGDKLLLIWLYNRQYG